MLVAPPARSATLPMLLAAVLAAAEPAAQSVPLDELLDRAAAYEAEFIDRFSNVVAEEHYVQELSSPRRRRVLRSDVLLVRHPGAEEWQVFRDVFEVDGKPVRGPEEADRLTKLFTEPPRDALARVREIVRAGARYNLADIGTINNPLAALVFLQPDYRPRFRFNLAGLDRRVGPGVRQVRFQEFRRPTIMRTASNGDLLTNGLLWVEEATGRVVKTELRIGQARLAPEIVTTYRFDDELQIDVPAEMRDWYPDGATAEIRGVATYSRFRRFQVRTEEAVQP